MKYNVYRVLFSANVTLNQWLAAFAEKTHAEKFAQTAAAELKANVNTAFPTALIVIAGELERVLVLEK